MYEVFILSFDHFLLAAFYSGHLRLLFFVFSFNAKDFGPMGQVQLRGKGWITQNRIKICKILYLSVKLQF
jgi:hypothetical protein